MGRKDEITRDDLVEIIRATEDAGRDASELKAILASMPQPAQSRSGGPRRFREEDEPTTAELLNRKAGGLFPDGITDDVLAELIRIDSQYTLTELRAMCKDAGLGITGDKKVLAAKLLTNGHLLDENET